MVKFSWKRFLAAGHDIFMAGLAMVIALGARYGFDDSLLNSRVLIWVLSFMGVSAVCFQLLGLGRGMWRFASITDLRTIVLATTTSIIVFLFGMFLINRLDAFPRMAPIIAWFVMVVLLGGPRMLYRALRDGGLVGMRPRDMDGSEREDVLIAGTHDQADQLIRSYGLEQGKGIKVHGIIEHRPEAHGRHLRGIPVVGGVENIDAIVERLSRNGVAIKAVVVAEAKEKAELQPLLAAAARLRIPLRRVVPAPITGNRPNLEAISVEDLLGRPPVRLDLDRIRALIADRVVFVTGAGGSIGSEIVRQVASFGPSRLIILDSSEYALYLIDQELERTLPRVPRSAVIGDVRDRERIHALMQAERPSVVFHAAALKHVPLVEANQREGVMTNAVGSRNVADAAVAAGVEAFVMISTDKAIRPTSVMGATKRAAEAYCQALDVSGISTRFITVRFGNVLGSTGSVVPLFKKQIEAGGPVTVTHPDMKRFFMTITEATQLVLQAAADGMVERNRRGRVFVLDMGEPVKIVDLARTMILLSGLRPDEDIAIEFSGVRSGEKLFEELFDSGEDVAPSNGEGIFVVSAKLHQLEWIAAALETLEDAAARDDRAVIRATLGTIAPDARFEQLT